MGILNFALSGNYKRFYNDLKELSKTNHKSAFVMFIDTGLSTIFFGSGLQDYLNYKFYEKSFKERKQYATIGNTAKAYKTLDEEKKKAVYLEKLYAYIRSIEAEKIYYFALVYNQKTVIIKAPSDNSGQKKFLGYDWSNRKGNEGIQIITPGGKMYDDADREKEGTLAHALRRSFAGAVPEFKEEQSEYGSVVNARDMFDFSRVSFNKAVKLSFTQQQLLKSKYPMQKLGVACNVINYLFVASRFSINFNCEI